MDATISFYEEFAKMSIVHERISSGKKVVWLSDHTRPFVIVFFEVESLAAPLGPIAHLGVAYESKAEVDEKIALALSRGIEVEGPNDSGPPAGYWVFLKDPDGHTLELSYGQEVSRAVSGAVNP